MAYLLTNDNAGLVAGIMAGIVSAVVPPVAWVLRIWIEQQGRTRRLEQALRDTKPPQRAEIITAFSRLERAAARPTRHGRIGGGSA
ncbi:hypothetical protein ACQP2P_13580 [Dactylosporangium sp. CA-139114]|uniref:hypothetical protein n=1 Tax=Dactylosporangium sp. CA-139114 TaxID=3239931 RepID=UPI003D984A76